MCACVCGIVCARACVWVLNKGRGRGEGGRGASWEWSEGEVHKYFIRAGGTEKGGVAVGVPACCSTCVWVCGRARAHARSVSCIVLAFVMKRSSLLSSK